MSKRNLHVLASPAFLLGLLLLLLNDFIFKEQFHNELTGKLSDFAGLFVFPLFCAAFFPRLKPFIYFLTAVLFTFWKSAYSQPIIETWNNLAFFSIERTVDYGDLLALIILPLSYAYNYRSSDFRAPRLILYLIAIISMFAFTATQYRQTVSYNSQYRFQFSKKELMERMSHIPVHDVSDSFWNADTLEINFDSCTGEAAITVQEKENQSVVTLKKIDYRCSGEANRQQMLVYFEREFIDKLREDPVTRSSQVRYIRSSSISMMSNNPGGMRLPAS